MKLIIIDGGPASGKNTLGALLVKKFHKIGEKAVLLDLDSYVEEFNPYWIWENKQQEKRDQLKARINFAEDIDKYLRKNYIVIAIGERILTKKQLSIFIDRLKTKCAVGLFHLSSPLSLRKRRLHKRGPHSLIDLDKDQKDRNAIKIWPGHVYRNTNSPIKDAINLFQLIQGHKNTIKIK